MADQKMKGRRRVSLMIMVLIFQVLSASLHGCFAVKGQGQPPRKPTPIHPRDGVRSYVFLPVSGNVYPLGYCFLFLIIVNILFS